jgi:hypothetical protein
MRKVVTYQFFFHLNLQLRHKCDLRKIILF